MALSRPVLPLAGQPARPPRYKMTSQPLGICVIINNETFTTEDGKPIEKLPKRSGTNSDRDKLKSTFSGLGFDVHCHENLSDKEMAQVVKNESTRDHSKYDCFILCILSHGNREGVFGSNGRPVYIQDLIHVLSPLFCPTLSDKPKLLFMQACQGSYIQRGHPSAHLDTNPEAERLIPTGADFLLAYSTVPGYVSFRDGAEGSYFIRTLTEILDANAQRLDIMKILTMVNGQLSNLDIYLDEHGHCKQCSGQQTTLTRDLYLTTTPAGDIFDDPDVDENRQQEHHDIDVNRLYKDLEFEWVDAERVILVVGKTKSGRSSVGNILLGEAKFLVGQPDAPSTTVSSLCAPSRGSRLKVVDTPDIDQMKLTYSGRKDEVARWKKLSETGPHVILLTIRCDAPFTPDDYHYYHQLKELWEDDEDFSRKLVIGFTFGDRLQHDVFKKIQESTKLREVLEEAQMAYVIFNDKASEDDKKRQGEKLMEKEQAKCEQYIGTNAGQTWLPIRIFTYEDDSASVTNDHRMPSVDEATDAQISKEATEELTDEDLRLEDDVSMTESWEIVSDQRVVLIIGNTGSGRSSVASILHGDDVMELGQFDYFATTESTAMTSSGECKLKVVECPGLNRMLTEEDKKKEAERWKSVSELEPDIILLAIRCDREYTLDDYNSYVRIRNLWTDQSDFCRRLIIGFTFGDRMQADFEEMIQKEGNPIHSVLKDAGMHYVILNAMATADEKSEQRIKLLETDQQKCNLEPRLSSFFDMEQFSFMPEHIVFSTLQSCKGVLSFATSWMYKDTMESGDIPYLKGSD